MPGLPWGGERVVDRARYLRFLLRRSSVDPIDGWQCLQDLRWARASIGRFALRLPICRVEWRIQTVAAPSQAVVVRLVLNGISAEVTSPVLATACPSYTEMRFEFCQAERLRTPAPRPCHLLDCLS